MNAKELDQALWVEWTKGMKLLGEGLVHDQLGIINAACTTVTGMENIVEKGAMFVQRKYYIGKFSEWKRKVAQFETTAADRLREARAFSEAVPAYESHLSEVFMDADDLLENEDWGDQAIAAFENLVNYVNGLMDALDEAQKVVEGVE